MAAITDLLVKIQILDERQHDAVMSRSRSTTGGHIVQQVAEMGYATEGTVARAISVELGLPRIDLSMTPPEPQALALLDARVCAERFVLPVALRENGELLWLAMADPTDQESIGVVRRKSQKRVRPAVAGPSEILRAVRALYASPNAGSGKPEEVGQEKLAAIEIAGGEDDTAFEVVNVSEDITGEASPLSKIAKQLGVEMPTMIPSRSKVRQKPADITGEEIALVDESPDSGTLLDARPVRPGPGIPPRSDPAPARSRPPPAPAAALTLDDLFAPPKKLAAVADDLSADDLATLTALSSSMEKGALVLRALAELCVEKGVFTREEMKKRNSR